MMSKDKILALFLGLLLGVNAQAYDVLLSADFHACMKNATGDHDFAECNNNESELQEVRLNQSYRQLIQGLAAKEKAAMIEAQRAWIKYRELETQRLATRTGGTIDNVNSTGFYLKFTAERVQDFNNELLH